MASPLPKLRRNATRVPDRPRYREQYGIVVICPNEDEQRRIYEALTLLGRVKLRVVTT